MRGLLLTYIPLIALELAVLVWAVRRRNRLRRRHEEGLRVPSLGKAMDDARRRP